MSHLLELGHLPTPVIGKANEIIHHVWLGLTRSYSLTHVDWKDKSCLLGKKEGDKDFWVGIQQCLLYASPLVFTDEGYEAQSDFPRITDSSRGPECP